MFKYIDKNESFTLDEFIDSTISEKIFNINENEILTKLSTAIKRKFDSLEPRYNSNIFVRATLADSTYKSQSNVVFSTENSRADTQPNRDKILSLKPKHKLSQKATILDWFKRDVSKVETVENIQMKEECVTQESEEQSQSGIVPVDIDPFGTLIISGDMLAFPSDSESLDSDPPHSQTDLEEKEVKKRKLCTTSSTLSEIMEEDQTSIERTSMINFPSDSRSEDICTSNVLDDSDKPPDSCDSTSPREIQDPNESSETQDLINNGENNDTSCVKDEDSGEEGKEEDILNLGNNVFIFYGNGNLSSASYWVLSKAFECPMKSLSGKDSIENEFVLAENKKIIHIDCFVLNNHLDTGLFSLTSFKEMLLSRRSRVSVLENFELLGRTYQILANKVFSSITDKFFILLCRNMNRIDPRVKSFSLMLRINGLDGSSFVEFVHKMVMKNNKNNYKNCLSKLNVIEIVNRVNFDVVKTYNTLTDAQRNYQNAIRKHKIPNSTRLLRSLVHLILHNKRGVNPILNSAFNNSNLVNNTDILINSPRKLENRLNNLVSDQNTIDNNNSNLEKNSNFVQNITNMAGNSSSLDNVITNQIENTYFPSPTTNLVGNNILPSQNSPMNFNNSWGNQNTFTLYKLISEIMLDYQDLNQFLLDFYNKLVETSHLDQEMTPKMTKLFSEVILNKNTPNVTVGSEFEGENILKIGTLVEDIARLIHNKV